MCGENIQDVCHSCREQQISNMFDIFCHSCEQKFLVCGKQLIATFHSKEVRMRDIPQNTMADSERISELVNDCNFGE